MPVEPIRRNYLLTEAFEIIGKRLFSDGWTGYELWARDIKPPGEIKSERAPLKDEIAKLDEMETALRDELSKTVDEERVEEVKTEIGDILTHRAELHSELSKNPEPPDSYYHDYQAFQRRNKAESTLLEALRGGDVKAHCLGGMVVDEQLWKGKKGFRYYIDLSMVVMPKRYSSRRRNSIRIPEGQFDAWLDVNLPIEKPETEYSLEERCKNFLKRESDKGPQRKTKPDYFDEAQTKIPGLSRRAFDRAWVESTPMEWRKRGRRKWPD